MPSQRVEFHWTDERDKSSTKCYLRNLLLYIRYEENGWWDWVISNKGSDNFRYHEVECGTLFKSDECPNIEHVRVLVQRKSLIYLGTDPFQTTQEKAANVPSTGNDVVFMGWQVTIMSLMEPVFVKKSYLPVMDLIRLICTYFRPLDYDEDFMVLDDQIVLRVAGMWSSKDGVHLLIKSPEISTLSHDIVTFDHTSQYRKPKSAIPEHSYPVVSIQIGAAFDGYRQVISHSQISHLEWLNPADGWKLRHGYVGYRIYELPHSHGRIVHINSSTVIDLMLSDSVPVQYRSMFRECFRGSVDALICSERADKYEYRMIIATPDGHIKTIYLKDKETVE